MVRKPKTSLQRPKPGKKKKETSPPVETNRTRVEDDRTRVEDDRIPKKGFENRPMKPKKPQERNQTPETVKTYDMIRHDKPIQEMSKDEVMEDWRTVKHNTRGGQKKKDIALIIGRIDKIIHEKQMLTNNTNDEQILQFRGIQDSLKKGEPKGDKLEETLSQLHDIANAMGHTDVLETEKTTDKTTSASTPESLTQEFNVNKFNVNSWEHENEETTQFTEENFDLQEDDDNQDITDLPDLHYEDDPSVNLMSSQPSYKDLLPMNGKDKPPTNEEEEEESRSEETQGSSEDIKFILHYDDDKNTIDEATTRIEAQARQTESILDNEIKAMAAITHIHTPKVHRSDMREDIRDTIEDVVEQSINNLWKDQKEELEDNLEQEMQRCRDYIEQEQNKIKSDFENMRGTIAQERKEMSDVKIQSDILKKQLHSKNRQFHSLKTDLEEQEKTIQRLTKQLKEETDKIIMETDKAKTAQQELEQLRTLTNRTCNEEIRDLKTKVNQRIESTLQESIQQVVDKKMYQVEQAMHTEMKKRALVLLRSTNGELAVTHERRITTMEERLDVRVDDVFNQASSLLDDAVMQIGKEMEQALDDFRNQSELKNIRDKTMNAIQKQITGSMHKYMQALNDTHATDIKREIDEALQIAKDDLHVNQGCLLTDFELSHHLHNTTMTKQAKELLADLRKEAEIIQAEHQTLIEDLRREAETIQGEVEAGIDTAILNMKPQNGGVEHPDKATAHSSEASNIRQKLPWARPPASQEEPLPNKGPSNPYSQRNRGENLQPSVSIPSEETWVGWLSRCTERATLTYSFPHNATDLTPEQAESFYRQTVSNFRSYPAIRLRPFEDLTRRGNSVPLEYAMGWPPDYLSHGSSILYEKLVEAIPTTLLRYRSILDQFQRSRDGYLALTTLMKRTIPRLGQLPPKMEPLWTKSMAPTEYANILKTYIEQQAALGRYYCDFEIAATMAQRAMEHPEYFSVGSNRAQQLIHMARDYDEFREIVMAAEDNPHAFATVLETYQQEHQTNHISMMEGTFNPSINKFAAYGGQSASYGGQNRNRNSYSRDKEGKPKDGAPREICPCCLRRGHNLEKGSVCWLAAQVTNIVKYIKDQPEKAQKNLDDFNKAQHPITIAKMQVRFPEEFRNMEPDSDEMVQAAVDLFEMFQLNTTE
jgi:hypothetical protein